MPSTNQYVSSKGMAMLQCKCARCQTGNMFKAPATNLKRFMEMNEVCENCGLRFEIEPGFFWGAMYVSYALTTALMLISCGTLLLVFNDPDFWVYVATIIVAVVVTLPWVFRYSRMLMLHLFSPVRFDKTFVK